MTFQLGIDFGTSTTVAVLRAPDGRIRPLVFDGSELLPSAVCAFDDGSLLVGRDALHAAKANPAGFEPNPKRSVDDGMVLLGGREIPVVTLFAAVLGRVAAEAERVAGGPVQAVTLTCPAGWGPHRRETLSAAAVSAGLAPPVLVAEPVAATGYFVEVARGTVPVGACVVVYDFGAGTFDASVVRRSSDGFDVLAERGLPDAGGLDIDAAITANLGTVYAPRDAAAWDRLIRPTTVADRRAALPFRDDVRAGKEILSRAPSTFIHVPLIEDDALLTRAQVEQLARPILDRTVRTTLSVLRQARVGPGEVAGLFLVGGSSRIPLVATMLHQELGLAPTVMERPELVVAEGSLHVRPMPPAEATLVVPGGPSASAPPLSSPVRATAAVPVSGAPTSAVPVSGMPAPVSAMPVSASPVSTPPASAPPVSTPAASPPPAPHLPPAAPPVGPRLVPPARPPSTPAGAPAHARSAPPVTPPPPWWHGWQVRLGLTLIGLALVLAFSVGLALPVVLLVGVVVTVVVVRRASRSSAARQAVPWWRRGRKPYLALTVLGVLALVTTVVLVNLDGFSGSDEAGSGGTSGPAADMYSAADLSGHSSTVNALAFSPDGTKLASAGDDKTVRLWRVPYGGSLGTLNGHRAEVLAVRFSADGRTVMSGDAEGRIVTWDTATQSSTSAVSSNLQIDGGFAFNPDGTLAAAATAGGTVTLWTVATGRTVVSPPAGGGSIEALAFSPDGTLLAGGRNDGDLLVWAVPSGKLVAIREGRGGGLLSVAFSPDSKTIVAGGYDREVRLWSATPGQDASVVVAEHVYPAYGVAFNPSGSLLLTVDSGGMVRVRDKQAALSAAASASPSTPGNGAAATGGGINPSGGAIGGSDTSGGGIGDIRPGSSGQAYPSPSAQPEPVDRVGYTGSGRSVAWSPDGRFFAVGGSSYVSLWRTP